jgi:serine/threonine protein phosphatase PrpC
MNIKILQLHKRASYEYKYIQDKCNISINNKCIALSDGTTQSFKSELWAKMIVDSFINQPTFDLNIVKEQFKKLAFDFQNNDFEYSTNFAKAALEKDKQKKGGTATFIGLQYQNEDSIKVLNCGDTCLFIIKKNKITPFPFKSLDELDHNDYFINSTKLIEDKIDDECFNFTEIKVEKDDIIILATDAISRLIFRKPEVINLLIKINNFEELKQFCLNHWDNKELEEDDISIVIVSPFLPTKLIEIVPPKDFSFPKEEEIEFVPSIGNQNYINDIDPIQMQQLNRMIQDLFRETNFLKNKLKLTQVLLISALLLLVLNTALLFYFIKNNNVNNLKEENTITTSYETNEPEVVTEAKTEKDVNNTPPENNSSAKEQKDAIIKEPNINTNVQNENDNEKASSNSDVIIKNTSKTDKAIEQKKITTEAPKNETKNDNLNK